MKTGKLSPKSTANRLSRILEAYSADNINKRFPVDVKDLALQCGKQFDLGSEITEIQAADIKNFVGCLFSNDSKDKWKLLYNNTLSSGRIRFTQAHELGHYLLHRTQKDSFQCNENDMLNWSDAEKDIEAQADQFASYLLMPLDDYRKQVTSRINMDLFSHCADRYGVSMIASILKWLDYTDIKAVLIISNDGFMNWAWSSKAAFKAGAFFKTRSNIIPIPEKSLAANTLIFDERNGANIAANIWFEHAERDMDIQEMKIYSNQHDMIITLLVLPKPLEAWPPRNFD
ncbi:MAG: ImmA/IrrE family metallo-endopeptidase [Gammaproteobacteria bacterium]|nr:ImmA/IrrE family metallo-endopeptidase [Gammaproteobacteria bacterium]